ncbi:MAG: hypothetical protein RLZ25_260 [Pseudomonadota bacterium]|jgi:conjugal transfer pilus assembly protein TraA
MKTDPRPKIMTLLIIGIALLSCSELLLAGTGGSSEFGNIYTLLTGWLQGMLGRILAVTFMLVGLVSGVMRGSMMGLVLGIACGLGVYTAPTVIDNIVTAVIP